MRLKRCTKCGTPKLASEFRTRKGASDGLTSWCRSCLNEASKLTMRKHLQKPGVRERFREKDRRRYREVIKANPERLAAERAKKRAYNASRTPEQKARAKVWHAEHAKLPEVKARRRELARKRIERPGMRERIAVIQARYHQTPKGKAALARQSRKWRAMIKGARVNDLTDAQWSAIVAASGGRCFYCKQPRKLTMDHLTPLSRGGDHTASNVVAACLSCNSRKNDRTLAEFLTDAAE